MLSLRLYPLRAFQRSRMAAVVRAASSLSRARYIDLSKDFLTVVPGVTKLCTLYSIVNSLVELADINKVQFTIDGEMVSFFGDSSIMFDVPLERNLEIIKE